MVVRVPIGGYLTGGVDLALASAASRSSPTSPACSSPSRRAPATPSGLLRTAFRCEDPVLFLEHKHLLRQPYNRDPFPPADWLLPFGRGAYVDARRTRHHRDVGRDRAPRRARRAASSIADGGAVEIIDLRTIVPWDQRASSPSRWRKTGRVLVVHEDTLHVRVRRRGRGVDRRRVLRGSRRAGAGGSPRSTRPSPYEPTLEHAILPQVDDIARDLRALLAY